MRGEYAQLRGELSYVVTILTVDTNAFVMRATMEMVKDGSGCADINHCASENACAEGEICQIVGFSAYCQKTTCQSTDLTACTAASWAMLVSRRDKLADRHQSDRSRHYRLRLQLRRRRVCETTGCQL